MYSTPNMIAKSLNKTHISLRGQVGDYIKRPCPAGAKWRKMEKTKYIYGMRLRGFSPGCQPQQGLVKRLDSDDGSYLDILIYDRLLNAEEEKHYSLTQLKDSNGKLIPVTTIDSYVKQNKKPIMVNGIMFMLTGVNFYGNADINEKTRFDDDIELSFLERLERAIEELNQITGKMTLEDAQNFFKDNTEEGNSNYWGEMISVYTKSMPKKYIMFDVRMD